mmetsp:Transcript_61028/g.137726  ORF Transcript_61028/g.137726 Transcript_61028/m.137726 type:complete len:220 (+) Transcript_61028:103-762(+)
MLHCTYVRVEQWSKVLLFCFPLLLNFFLDESLFRLLELHLDRVVLPLHLYSLNESGDGHGAAILAIQPRQVQRVWDVSSHSAGRRGLQRCVRLKQLLDYSCMAMFCCQHDGSTTVKIYAINRRIAIHQKLHDVVITTHRAQHEWCVHKDICLIYEVELECPSGHSIMHHIIVSVQGCIMQHVPPIRAHCIQIFETFSFQQHCQAMLFEPLQRHLISQLQ